MHMKGPAIRGRTSVFSGRADARRSAGAFRCRLRGPLRLMMQNEKLVRHDCEFSVRFSFVIAEFNFVSPIQQLHDSAYLAADQIMLRQIRKKSYHI